MAGTTRVESRAADAHTKYKHRTPWHLWVVGLLALLWRSVGAMDYLMTQTGNEEYLSQFTPEQLAFFAGFPAWLVAFWAVAVWGGVLGAILLLLRRRAAVWVLLASFVSMVIVTIRNYVFAGGLEVIGDTFSLVFSAIIFVVALALVLYALSLQRRGVLV
ncbi:MAG TPA: hypothetical protein VLT59_10915 [Steroidobacteraceae bacterium]|nr:hypothetical protein [Steroidobacteraceae bacterium]